MSIAPKANQLMLDSILDVADRIKRAELSSASLVDLAFERIDATNPRLNAFITVTRELARGQAANADNEIRSNRWRGPLHGIPVAVKDFYDTAGIRTTAGFAHFAQRVPTKNAAMVDRLRDAGAVLVGKTEHAPPGVRQPRRSRVISDRWSIRGIRSGSPADPRVVPRWQWRRACASERWTLTPLDRAVFPPPSAA
jgi:hypothetical protein